MNDKKTAAFHYWREQRAAVQDRLSAETLLWYDRYTAKADNFGEEMGMIRPDVNLGKWDLYFWLTDPEIGCDKNEALIAAGLTAAEVAEFERREKLLDRGIDPDDPHEIAFAEALDHMSASDLEATIARLEQQLGRR